MKIAGIQFDIAWESPSTNFSTVRRLASMAKEQGASWVVLPEMFATGFSMNADAMAQHAEEIQGFLQGIAAELGLWVVGGYAEPTSGRPRNAAVIVSPKGEEVLPLSEDSPFYLWGRNGEVRFGRPNLHLRTRWGSSDPLHLLRPSLPRDLSSCHSTDRSLSSHRQLAHLAKTSLDRSDESTGHRKPSLCPRRQSSGSWGQLGISR